MTTARAPRESARAPRESSVSTCAQTKPNPHRIGPHRGSTSNPLVSISVRLATTRKMLRTLSAHCRKEKHKQPIGSISVRLATTRKCCAHLVHTAEYRSTTTHSWFHFGQTRNNQKLRTPSAHRGIQKHKQPIGSISVRLATPGKCCAHLARTTEYRNTSNPLVPFRSDSQQLENAAHTYCILQNTEAQATHWFHFCQTRNTLKMLRTPRAHCRIQKHKQPIGSISVRLVTTRKYCARRVNTAEYRSPSNPLVPFLSDSQHLENAAHT